MRWEYLTENSRREYFRLLMDGKLNEHFHEVDVECHAMVERIVGQMKAGTGITEKLKAGRPLEWTGLMNNVRNAAEEIVYGK